MGHRSYLLTLPVLAAQSPVGLEHNVDEGWSLGGGWHVAVMSGETWRGGGGGDAMLHQGRVHQGWQKGMRLGRACPRHWFSFGGLQELPRFGVSWEWCHPQLMVVGHGRFMGFLRTKHGQYSNLSPNPSHPYHTPHCL